MRKLIVSDLDGTLYPENTNNATDEDKKAIHQWLEDGNIFAIATARIHFAYDPLIQNLGFPVDFLGSNGSEIILADGTKETHTLPYTLLIEIHEWLKKTHYRATVKINIQDQWIYNDALEYPFDTPSRMRNPLKIGKPMNEVTLDKKQEGVNMSVIAHPDDINQIQSALSKMLAAYCTIAKSAFDNLDLIPLGCSKGDAVIRLAQLHQIEKEKIIVIGDSENDISMFEVANKSYCMDSGDELAKAKAKFITSSVHEVIEKERGE